MNAKYTISASGLCLLVSVMACDNTDNKDTSEARTWADYSVDPPSGEVLQLLNESPLLYPTKECHSTAQIDHAIPASSIETAADGSEQVCVWENTTGTVPEGMTFTDLADCSKVFTQAPSWFVEPRQVFESDPSILDDSSYREESDWVRDQIRSSGCACCHASSAGSGNTSGFDVDAPQAWTDSIENYQLAMISGIYPEHRFFGALPPDENHGFIRDETMFPSTDSNRMRDFFLSELERRNASQADFDEGERVLQSFFSRLFEAPTQCVSPWTGFEDDKIIWNSEGGVRQIYVLKENAETPGFPPTEDTPVGTVWALYVNPDAEPIGSGQIGLGEKPPGTTQFVPADGSAPVLEHGSTYRLFATPDFQLIRELNCTFVYKNSVLK